MFTMSKMSKCGLTFLVLVAFGSILLPMEALAAPAKQAKGNLIGFVYLLDLDSPLADAVVKIRSLKSGEEFQSQPTDKNGSYKLQGIEEGQYILGVSAKNGTYNLEVLIQLKGGETGKLTLVLKESAANAVLGKKGSLPMFFAKPLGIIGLAGAAAAVAVSGTGLINEPVPAPASASRR